MSSKKQYEKKGNSTRYAPFSNVVSSHVTNAINNFHNNALLTALYTYNSSDSISIDFVTKLP
jgi:hypothetical protein